MNGSWLVADLHPFHFPFPTGLVGARVSLSFSISISLPFALTHIPTALASFRSADCPHAEGQCFTLNGRR